MLFSFSFRPLQVNYNFLDTMTCNTSVTNSCGLGGVCTGTANASSCFCRVGYVFNDVGLCEELKTPMAYSAVPSFCWLCFLLVLGKFLRLYLWIFQKLYLPASVIGGILGLIMLQVASLNKDVTEFIALNFTRGWYVHFLLCVLAKMERDM